MASYKVSVKASAQKELNSLPKQIVSRVYAGLTQLAENPFPAGYKKLRGEKPATYRVRVGDYRILYIVDTKRKTLVVTGIGHRNKVYE